MAARDVAVANLMDRNPPKGPTGESGWKREADAKALGGQNGRWKRDAAA
jgi:hypothetical protein